MKSLARTLFAAVLALPHLATCPTVANAQSWGVVASGDERRPRRRPPAASSFRQTIDRVVSMPSNGDLQRRVRERGLNVVNVMWEDTARYQGSSVGPNISDLTLQVRENIGDGTRTHLLPVIRHPNFSDRTADVPMDKLWVRVGNERGGGRTRAVPLEDVLSDLREYVSYPNSLNGSGDLTAERDTHALVSAQHVFVPLRAEGRAEFNPVLYNYQSSPGNPAVLVLLATRQGTSIQVIENRPGDQSVQGWGQQLFFDNEGQRTVFTAERRSAVADRIERGEAEDQDEGALEEGADMMMVIQVPLRRREPPRAQYGAYDGMALGGGTAAQPVSAAPMPAAVASSSGSARRAMRSDVETAVIGHGEDMGRFPGLRELRLVRDERFPIRVTVQFYKATSNGVVDAEDLDDARRAIDRVYADADYVGSLVVPEGDRTPRPTGWSHRRR
jgi:hypothetical protein